jgi:integrase/recombinase XerC
VAEAVEELFTRFEEHLVRSALASRTIVNYLADLRTFARWHADVKGVECSLRQGSGQALLVLTPDDIRQYRRHMQINEGWTPATINRRLQAVRKFYSFAVETGLTGSNPASEVQLIPMPESNSPRVLDSKEVASLLEAVEGGRPSLIKRDYAIIQLLLQTGIKLGELTSLRLSDVQFPPAGGGVGDGEGLLLVGGGEGNNCRQVPLNPSACAALQDYLQTREQGTGEQGTRESATLRPCDPATLRSCNLFLSQGGGCISGRAVQRLVRVYAKAAGLEDVSAHVLRRTFAASTLADTGDVPLVSRLLGHRCLETTAKYLISNIQSGGILWR